MSTHDILTHFGVWALVRFVAGVAVFVALYVVRVPFAAMVRVLDAGMGRVDAYVTAGLSAAQAGRARATSSTRTRSGGERA